MLENSKKLAYSLSKEQYKYSLGNLAFHHNRVPGREPLIVPLLTQSSSQVSLPLSNRTLLPASLFAMRIQPQSYTDLSWW